MSEIDTSSEAVEKLAKWLDVHGLILDAALVRALAAQRDNAVFDRKEWHVAEDERERLTLEQLDQERRDALEEAAKEVETALCDVSVDTDLFMQVRDHLAGLIRSLAEKEARDA